MNKNIQNILFAAVLALALSISAFAQTAVLPTTLTNAIAQNDTTFVVASTSGMTASATGAATFIVVGYETMNLTAIPASGTVTVRRTGPGNPVRHAAGEYVYYGTTATWAPSQTGSPTSGVFLSEATRPSGSCTRTSQGFLPLINPGRRSAYDCLGGKWVEGTLPDDRPALTRACNTANTGAAYFVNGTLTTASFSLGVSTVPGTSGNMYISSIFIPTTRVVTGMSILNGSAVGTSLTLNTFYDATGTVLARSNTAGVSGGTVNTYWDIPFGTAILVVGPARYNFGASSVGGTGAYLLMGAAGALGDVAGRMTAGTFGTTPSLTITTAFTSAQVPQGCSF